MKKVHIIILISSFMGIGVMYFAQGIPWKYSGNLEVTLGNDAYFEMPKTVESCAKVCYKSLNSSQLFNTSFIRNPNAVRQWHETRLGGKFFATKTVDDTTIHGTFFDRKSDTLLVIGPGFTNNRELLSPFIDMFADYDIALMDFRGHNYVKPTLTDIESWPLCPSKVFFGADADDVTFGKREELDVYAVVDYCKKHKTYKKICGLGVCYGAFIFLKTAALRPDCFDKLILDGCWLSLRRVIDKLKKDLRMICVPQEGGWSNHWLLKREWAQDFVEWLTVNFMGFDLGDISLLDYTKLFNNKLSILFFYGKDDLMVTRQEFETLWNSIKIPQKSVIITSNPHVRNHWKQKELYTLIGKLFLEEDFTSFGNYLRDEKLVIEWLCQKQRLALTH